MKLRAGAVILLFLALPLCGVCSEQEQASQPRYKDGDFWIFRGNEREGIARTTDALQGDYKVLFSGGRRKFFYIEDSKEVQIPEGSTTYQVGILGRMLSLREDPLQYLLFPLTVGKKWNSTFRTTIRGTTTARWNRAESQVAAIEEVSTPAGAFHAFKIERQHSWETLYASMIYYYSPRTKSIVKYSYHEENHGSICCKREIELLNFGSVP